MDTKKNVGWDPNPIIASVERPISLKFTMVYLRDIERVTIAIRL